MSLTEARQGRELEAEARQSEIDVVCVVLISCTMHMYILRVLALWTITFINEKHYIEVS